MDAFLQAQAKADSLKEAALGEVREYVKSVQARMGVSMAEVLGPDILHMLSLSAVAPAQVTTPARTPAARPMHACYLNPTVVNVPQEIEKKIDFLSRLASNDLISLADNPDHSEAEWLRSASAQERKKMIVPNPKWWRHPMTTDAERNAWKP